MLGADHGVGTTHLTFMICNYLRNILGKTVALMETDKNSNFFQSVEAINLTRENQYVTIHEIDLYNNMDINVFFQKAYGFYDYILFDIGPDSREGKQEFTRCDKKIVVGSLSEWKFKYFYASVQEWQEIPKVQYCSLSYNTKNSIQMYKKFGVKIVKIPFDEDPFFIKPQNAEWLKRILQ